MKVIQTIQSNDPFKTGVVEAPCEIVFYNGDSMPAAMAAMAQAAAIVDDDRKFYRVLAVHLSIEDPEV